ncbi:MAG TPA: hypothetical protein VHF22_16045 [Planctomycetota bacterium]|nr:hypothetical protein [Planctomycetota bacterium]
MDADAIEAGLAAWGYPLFTRVPEGAPKPDLAELIRACLGSENPRHEGAVVALLLANDVAQTQPAVAALLAGLPDKELRRLRRSTLAADYLAEIYDADFRALLGRDATPPVELFDRGALPPRAADDGEAGLRALAAEIAREESEPWIDWAGSLEDPAVKLIKHLWIGKGRELAQARHARAH